MRPYPRPQAQEQLGRLLGAHELRDRLRHHGDELLHLVVAPDVPPLDDLPDVGVGQLQRGGQQAQGRQGEGGGGRTWGINKNRERGWPVTGRLPVLSGEGGGGRTWGGTLTRTVSAMRLRRYG